MQNFTISKAVNILKFAPADVALEVIPDGYAVLQQQFLNDIAVAGGSDASKNVAEIYMSPANTPKMVSHGLSDLPESDESTAMLMPRPLSLATLLDIPEGPRHIFCQRAGVGDRIVAMDDKVEPSSNDPSSLLSQSLTQIITLTLMKDCTGKRRCSARSSFFQ